MRNKSGLIFLILSLVVVSVLFFFQKKQLQRLLSQNEGGSSFLQNSPNARFSPHPFLELPDHSVVEWTVAGKTLTVEIVNTPQSIEKGLGERESLESDGMLFVFPSPTRPGFWMKGMKFPIDLYWIQSGEIIGIQKNMIPPSSATGERTVTPTVSGSPSSSPRDSEFSPLPVFYPPSWVDMVLEIPVSKNIELEV